MIISDICITVYRTCISIFSKIGLVDQSKTVHTNLFAKKLQEKGKLHKFATTNSNFEKAIVSDIHHRITNPYKYVINTMLDSYSYECILRPCRTCGRT